MILAMKIQYSDKKVESYCNEFAVAKKMFNEKVANELSKLMTRLRALDHMSLFGTAPTLRRYHYHPLYDEKDKPKDRWALRIDFSYRMTLVVKIIGNENGEDTIKILEVTKHYGD